MDGRILGVCLLLSLVAVSQAAVISIDFSGEWIKVALVKVRHDMYDNNECSQ